jgi:hypothetical protein
MIIRRNIKKLLLTGVLVLTGFTGYSQDADCKVIMPSISGKYTGECRKGLAHGQGTSEGIDRYSGGFKNGLPHGIGTYTWAEGTIYEGHWSNGTKDGGGKMVTRDSTYTGIWKEDKYIGKEIIPSYKITHTQNVIKSTLIKTNSTNYEIRIRFFQGSVEGGGLISVDLAYNTGVQYRDGSIYGIQHPSFPIDIRISFKANDRLGTGQFDADYDFTINEPGSWDVRISY